MPPPTFTELRVEPGDLSANNQGAANKLSKKFEELKLSSSSNETSPAVKKEERAKETAKYRDEVYKLCYIRNKLKTTKHTNFGSTTKATTNSQRSIKDASWLEGGIVFGKNSVQKVFNRELVLKEKEGNRVYSLLKDWECGMENKITEGKLKEVDMDDDVESDEDIVLAGQARSQDLIVEGFESVFRSDNCALVINLRFN